MRKKHRQKELGQQSEGRISTKLIVSKMLRFPEIQSKARAIHEEFMKSNPNPDMVYGLSLDILGRFVGVTA